MVDVAALLKGPADRFMRKYNRGQVIFEEGDHGAVMYFIYSGKVRLSTKYHGREVTLAVVGPGDFFGEMALIDLSTRSATAVAEDDGTQLLELDRGIFLDLVGTRPSFAMIVMQTLCGRIRERWKVIQDLKEEVARTGGKLEVELKWPDLEAMSTAIKVVFDQMIRVKTDSESRIVSNVRELIFPYLEKLKMGKLGAQERGCLSVIEENLNRIIEPFLEHLALGGFKLTPTEMQIASLIRDGKTTKEIADLLNLSTATVDFHRNNIRSKLGLTNKRESLKVRLQSIARNH